MPRIMTGLVAALVCATALAATNAAAGGFTPVGGDMLMAQNMGNPNSRTITRDRDKPRQRYVCVVPGSGGTNVCHASAGRIGGVCRCPGTVGSGRLQFD